MKNISENVKRKIWVNLLNSMEVNVEVNTLNSTWHKLWDNINCKIWGNILDDIYRLTSKTKWSHDKFKR